MPFRIKYTAIGPGDEFNLDANHRASSWVPLIESRPLSDRKLAVVGGSPDVVQDLDTLRQWDGDIWGINGTAAWLKTHGIKATLYSVDPALFPSWMLEGIDDAILASVCHPEVFEQLRGKVRRFTLVENDPKGIVGGCTSALKVPLLAPKLGYSQVHFFGCSGSFDFGSDDHCSHDMAQKRRLIVRAGGVDYQTYPEYYMQSQTLADICSKFPEVYVCRSRGLVRAMMDHADTWEVVAVSAAEKEAIESCSGESGMYEKPYEVAHGNSA